LHTKALRVKFPAFDTGEKHPQTDQSTPSLESPTFSNEVAFVALKNLLFGS
jgi:hypothetical protein